VQPARDTGETVGANATTAFVAGVAVVGHTLLFLDDPSLRRRCPRSIGRQGARLFAIGPSVDSSGKCQKASDLVGGDRTSGSYAWTGSARSRLPNTLRIPAKRNACAMPTRTEGVAAVAVGQPPRAQEISFEPHAAAELLPAVCPVGVVDPRRCGTPSRDPAATPRPHKSADPGQRL